MLEKNIKNLLACPMCMSPLKPVQKRLTCEICNKEYADIETECICFDNCIDEKGFFTKQGIEWIPEQYNNYTRQVFLESLAKREYWEMDEKNKLVGITRKLWWENYIGKVEHKRILEIGCGVNYITPYWLECKNDVVAIDNCRESINFLSKVIQLSGVPMDKLVLAVADVTAVRFLKKFDIIQMNNVLHHIKEYPILLNQLRNYLADDGRILIVEPNYYYPPRWIVETELFDPVNPIRNYFIRNELFEEDEKGIRFSILKKQLKNAGCEIVINMKDNNWLGYGNILWVKSGTALAKAIYILDHYLFSKVIPAILAPFEYIIARKSV
ncbi:MAG: class I SAM-dependent methyltransferase [Desulfobacterales bacterium]|nr:class I SAM-dependent methyltransferase [Desulfobacterales bacterium]